MPAKDQEEYEAVAKCHGSTIQRTPTPKGENVGMGTKCK